MRSLRYFVLFLLLNFLIYFPVITAGFAADDYPQLVHQPFFHNLTATTQVFNKVISSQSGQNTLTGFFYRPLTFSIYILIYNLSHANPFYFHFFQLLLYSAVTYLLFLFFTNFFSYRVSLLLSFIFLIHPANNELAAYIAALSDTLCLFFGLLALNRIIKTNQINTQLSTLDKCRMYITYLLIVLCLFLSLLSKETGIIFVILSLMYMLSRSSKKSSHSHIFKKTVLSTNIFSIVIPLLIYIPLRIIASKHPMFVYLANPKITPHSNRFIFLPQIALAFFSEILTPTRKPIHDNFFQNNGTADIIPLIILLLCAIACYLFWRWTKFLNREYKHGIHSSTHTFSLNSSKILLQFYSWIILGLILYLQIFPLEFLFAERWLSITEIGFLGILGVALSSFHFPINKWTILCATLFGLLLLLYLGETIHLNVLWHDWQHHLA